MAVYEGARPRPAFLPRRPRTIDRPIDQPVLAPALPRRRSRAATRAGRRSNSIGLVLAGIVVAFLLAFFSLVQTVSVSATSYDIDRLLNGRARLEAQRQQLLFDLNRLGGGPAIRRLAIDLGLAQLGEPLVIPAR
jgi:hypothetical protein